MLISTTTFLSRVAARTGLSPDACGKLVEQTMKVLAGQLGVETLRELSGDLPPTLAVWIEEAPHGRGRGLSPLLEMGLPRDHIATVCGALAELLPPEMVEALRAELDEDVGVLLTPREQHPDDASAWRTRNA